MPRDEKCCSCAGHASQADVNSLMMRIESAESFLDAILLKVDVNAKPPANIYEANVTAGEDLARNDTVAIDERGYAVRWREGLVPMTEFLGRSVLKGETFSLPLLPMPPITLPSGVGKNTIKALIDQVEQLRVQLAGCGAAALGGTDHDKIAKDGDYGWSPSYRDTLILRRAFDDLVTFCRGRLTLKEMPTDPAGVRHWVNTIP